MPVVRSILFVYAMGVLIFHNDGVPGLTQRNMHRLHVTQIRSRCPARRTARAQEHFCPSATETVRRDIFDLASFRVSVNQTGLNVLDADVSDLGVGGRGALVLASAVFELVLTAQSQFVLGFVSCVSDVDLLIDAFGWRIAFFSCPTVTRCHFDAGYFWRDLQIFLVHVDRQVSGGSLKPLPGMPSSARSALRSWCQVFAT